MRGLLFLFIIIVLLGCKDDEVVVDTEYPEINLVAVDAFPVQCSELKRGETFVFRANFQDNVQLGSYSLDVHHNFDHHTHSTEVESCDMDDIKQPVKPFLFIKSYSIPPGNQTYVASTEIVIPADVDPGDYHFMIRLTDEEGWQTMKGLSVKIR